MASRGWTCRKCGHLNQPSHRKCRGLRAISLPAGGTLASPCEATRPKRRVPGHAVALRDLTYQDYLKHNIECHGVEDVCAVCHRPPKDTRNLDRDHGHLKGDPSYGKPRGLVCPACNILMPRSLDARRARLIADYLYRVEQFYASGAVA